MEFFIEGLKSEILTPQQPTALVPAQRPGLYYA